MSIANRLTTIAENEIKVYEAGIEDGKQAEYDRFWGNYKLDGMCAFAGSGWNNETFKPKNDIVPSTAYMMFRYSNIQGDLVHILENLGVVLDFSKCYSLQYTFQNTKFTRIGEIVAKTNFIEGFSNNPQLETIDKIVTTSSITYGNASFSGCTGLKNITFEGEIGNTINFQWCPLTKESITSIINALSATKTGQTATFKQTAKEAAFTDDEWATLIATKSNWTISLV